MKFLHLNHRYWPFPGGSERWIQEVSEHLASCGHDVRVVTSNAHDLEYFWRSDKSQVSAPRTEHHRGVRIERLPVRHGLVSGPFRFGALRRAQGEFGRFSDRTGVQSVASRAAIRLEGLEGRLLRSPVPDLIHVTNLSLEGLALAGARAARRLGVPYVITPFTHIGLEDDAIARRFVSMPHQRALMLNASAVILMSQRESAFVQDLGVPESRAFVAGAGVRPEELRGGNGTRFRESYSIGEEYLVGALGALAPDKGTPTLVDAIVELRRRGKPVQLVMAGPPLSSFSDWFGRTYSRVEGIHVLGVIDDSQKRDLLDAIDVLALPSRTESFGMVYLEAWSLDKPVIAARAGGVVDIVKDGENGLMVPFGNVKALAQAIDTLMGNAALAVRLGKRGGQLVEREYLWEHVLKRVESAYEHALAPARLSGTV